MGLGIAIYVYYSITFTRFWDLMVNKARWNFDWSLIRLFPHKRPTPKYSDTTEIEPTLKKLEKKPRCDENVGPILYGGALLLIIIQMVSMYAIFEMSLFRRARGKKIDVENKLGFA